MGNMGDSAVEDHVFRSGTAISVIILWVKVMAFLRNVLIDFAVFVGGVFYVVRRLAAFLMALVIILIAFAQMLTTVFQETEYCLDQPNNSRDGLNETELANLRIAEIQCDDNQIRPFCDIWSSFLIMYTMLLGEVDEGAFADSKVATYLFVLFMFLVVILLANVLIAIVTDSYKVIQDQRAAIVFWTNRLDFVAGMDAILDFVADLEKKLKADMGFGSDDDARRMGSEGVFGKEFWKRLMDLFEDDVDEGYMSIEFICFTLLRVLAAVFIIPFWIALGFLSAGILWPPQIREAVFTSTVSRHSSDTEKEDELRKTQVTLLEQEVKLLRDDLVQELAMDRTQIVQLKSHVAGRKVDIANEMKDIKRIVTMLFEQQSGL